MLCKMSHVSEFVVQKTVQDQPIAAEFREKNHTQISATKINLGSFL